MNTLVGNVTLSLVGYNIMGCETTAPRTYKLITLILCNTNANIILAKENQNNMSRSVLVQSVGSGPVACIGANI